MELRRLLPLAALAFSLAACTAEEEEPLDTDALTFDELAITVDEGIDGVDEDAELDESDDVVMDLEVDEDEVVADRPTRRQIVRQLVLRLAEDEPCALRGVLGGRYNHFEDDAEADGGWRGRAFRRNRRLVARASGTWNSGEQPGGDFGGAWENLEGATGSIDGGYLPRGAVEDIPLGTWSGAWQADDSDANGNVAGLWHPTREGRGIFIGYWSRCDIEPAHEPSPAS